MKLFMASTLSIIWLVSLAISFFAGRITNADQRLPEEFDKFRQLYGTAGDNTGLKWLSDPLCRVFGPFVVMRAEDRKVPGLYVLKKSSQPFPSVMILPGSSDSDDIERIVLRDKAGNSVSVTDKNKDGVFDFLFLESGNTLRMDKGLTGTWNHIQNRTQSATESHTQD